MGFTITKEYEDEILALLPAYGKRPLQSSDIAMRTHFNTEEVSRLLCHLKNHGKAINPKGKGTQSWTKGPVLIEVPSLIERAPGPRDALEIAKTALEVAEETRDLVRVLVREWTEPRLTEKEYDRE